MGSAVAPSAPPGLGAPGTSGPRRAEGSNGLPPSSRTGGTPSPPILDGIPPGIQCRHLWGPTSWPGTWASKKTGFWRRVCSKCGKIDCGMLTPQSKAPYDGELRPLEWDLKIAASSPSSPGAASSDPSYETIATVGSPPRRCAVCHSNPHAPDCRRCVTCNQFGTPHDREAVLARIGELQPGSRRRRQLQDHADEQDVLRAWTRF